MNKVWNMIFFVLGIAATLMFVRGCEEPEFIRDLRMQLRPRDTTYQTLTGDTVVRAKPVPESVPASPVPGAADLPVNVKPPWWWSGTGPVIAPAPDDTSLFRPAKKYSGVFKDSLVTIEAIASINNDTCKVDSFSFKYSIQMPVIRPGRGPEPPAPPPVVSGTFIMLHPASNGTTAGLGIGVSRVRDRQLYGLAWDPWLKEVRASIGYRFSK